MSGPDSERGIISRHQRGRETEGIALTRRQILALWLLWSAATLCFSAAASHLPTAIPNPWPAEAKVGQLPLARWDAGWYWQIAVWGYRFDPHEDQNNTEFYPLYPWIVKGLVKATGLPIFAVGTAVSLGCLLGAMLLLAGLVEDWGTAEDVFPTLAAMLAFPTAFFFAAFYTESLFLFTTVAAFRAARRGRWAIAGLAGAAACATRLNGILLLLPAAWLGGKAIREGRSSKLSVAGALGLIVAGAAIYPAYLWRRFGDPLLYLERKTSGAWAQKRMIPWRLIAETFEEARHRILQPGPDGRLNFWLKIACLLAFLLLTAILLLRRRIPEGLYTGANLAVLLGSGTIDASHRYVLALFPCFYVIGRFLRGRPFALLAYVFLGTGVGLLLMVKFIAWIYVA